MVALAASFWWQDADEILARGIRNKWAKDALFQAECRARQQDFLAARAAVAAQPETVSESVAAPRVAGRPGMVAVETAAQMASERGAVRETPGHPAAPTPSQLHFGDDPGGVASVQTKRRDAA